MSNYLADRESGRIAQLRPLTKRTDKPDIYWYEGYWRVSPTTVNFKYKKDLWIKAQVVVEKANQAVSKRARLESMVNYRLRDKSK